MKQPAQFKRRALILFLIVSLLPALTVSALWYAMARSNISASQFVSFGDFVIPVALLGFLPAVILAILFAELLAVPIRRLHHGITQIGAGDLEYRLKLSHMSEFSEMAESVNAIAANLEQTLAQKDSENEIIAAERNKLHAILENMTDGVLALDRSRHVMLFNQAAREMTGLPLSKVAGKAWDTIHLFEDDQGRYPFLEWLANKPEQPMKAWHAIKLSRAGDEPLRVNMHSLRLENDPSGLAVIVTFQDVSKFQQLKEMEINFVALAAHQLRTPLTTIKGYLDILQTEIGKKLSDEHRLFLQRSVNGLENLTGLTNNLLSVSRVEQGELNFDLEPTDWRAFMKEIQPRIGDQVTHDKRKLVIQIVGRLPRVAIDHFAIQEVFINLLDNAIKHTKVGDTIRIRCEAGHKGLEVRVIDKGTGIPAASVDRLFTKFFRVQNRNEQGGIGLGLYICKSTIEAHHGYIWVETELGKGSTFGFNLPAHQQASGQASKEKRNIIRGAHGWIKKHTHSRRRTAN
jgi:PAS domain S-box-containing protein